MGKEALWGGRSRWYSLQVNVCDGVCSWTNCAAYGTADVIFVEDLQTCSSAVERLALCEKHSNRRPGFACLSALSCWCGHSNLSFAPTTYACASPFAPAPWTASAAPEPPAEAERPTAAAEAQRQKSAAGTPFRFDRDCTDLNGSFFASALTSIGFGCLKIGIDFLKDRYRPPQETPLICARMCRKGMLGVRLNYHLTNSPPLFSSSRTAPLPPVPSPLRTAFPSLVPSWFPPARSPPRRPQACSRFRRCCPRMRRCRRVSWLPPRPLSRRTSSARSCTRWCTACRYVDSLAVSFFGPSQFD